MHQTPAERLANNRIRPAAEPSRRPRGASSCRDRPAPPPVDGRACLSPAASAPRRSSLRRRPRSLARHARAAALALACLAALALGVPEVARAQTVQTLVSNFGQGVQLALYANVGTISTSVQAFTTGSNPSGLTSIRVHLDSINTTPTSFTASIWTTNAQGEPLTEQFDLDSPASITTGGDKTFTYTGDRTLDPSTTYVVVFTADGDLDLELSQSAAQDGATGWLIADTYIYSLDGGNSWTPLSSPARPVRIEIKGTIVTNAAPTAANNKVETAPDTAYAFTAEDFRFADTDADDTLASVTIVTLPAVGTLTLDGAAVMTDQVIPKADIDAGKLTFTPVTGARDTPYTTFTFKVNDGTIDSAVAYTMTIDVTFSAPGRLWVREDARFRFGWSRPSNAGSTLTGYEYRYAVGKSVTGNPSWTEVPTERVYRWVVITGLQNSTWYTFEARAVYGTEKSAARSVTARTAVPTPRLRSTYAEGTARDTTIELSWTAIGTLGGEPVTGYRIEDSNDRRTWTELVASTGNQNTTYQHGGFTRGAMIRHYRVRALSANNTSHFSRPVGAGTRPPVPNKPVATLTGRGSYVLSWAPVEATSRGIGEYQFQIPGVRGVWTERPLIRGDGHLYIDPPRSVSVENIQVRAVIHGRRLSGGGYEGIASEWSDKASIATPGSSAAFNPFSGLMTGTRSHDGSRAFSLELHFNKAPEPLSERTVRDVLLEVTAGTVTDVQRLTPGSDQRWRITVQPAGADDVHVRLPARSPPCTDEATVCAGVERLAETVSHVVRGSGAVLSASFAAVPPSHDGETPFTVELRFSEEPALSYKTVRDSLLEVSGGAVTKASRVTQGSDRKWRAPG